MQRRDDFGFADRLPPQHGPGAAATGAAGRSNPNRLHSGRKRAIVLRNRTVILAFGKVRHSEDCSAAFVTAAALRA